MTSYRRLFRLPTTRTCLAAAVLLTCWSRAGAQGRLALSVNGGGVANFLYQLDCVAGMPIGCAVEDYQSLWRSRFLQTAEDSAVVREWRRFRRVYSISLPLRSGARRLSNGQPADLFQSPEVSLDDKVRIVGLQSASPEDYWRRLDAIIAPQDRGAPRSPFDRFWGRWGRWWAEGASAKTDEYAARLQSLANRADLAELRERFVDLYQSQFVPNDTLILTLMFRPGLVAEGTGGQQVDNYSLAEFLPDEPPEGRIAVILHELCHYLARQAPDSLVVALAERILGTGSPAARVAVSLLNEGMASALANGLVDRAVLGRAAFAKVLASPKSFYNNDAIDRAAKALFGWVDSTVAARGSLYEPEWALGYVRRLEAAFGKDLDAPRMNLLEPFFYADPKVADYAPLRRLLRGLGAASIYGLSDDLADLTPARLSDREGRDALVVMHPDHLGLHLAKLGVPAAARRQALRVGGEGVIGYRLPGSRWGFVVVAADITAAKRQIDRLAAATAPLIGVLR